LVMVRSTAAVVFFLMAAASAAPHDVMPLPPGSVINQTFYIFPPAKDNNPVVEVEVEVEVKVKSAVDNSPLSNVDVHFRISSTGESSIITTNSDGVATLEIDGAILPAEVELTAMLDQYDDEVYTMSVEQDNPDSQSILLSMTPKGKSVLKLNWNDKPKDLDLYVIQINPTSHETCLTNYQQKNSCDGLSLSIDGQNGGKDSPESITWADDYTGGYVYLVYVTNYSAQSQPGSGKLSLAESKARIAYGDHVHVNVPTSIQTNDKRHYWFVGCIDANDNFSERNELREDEPTYCLCTGGC